MSHEIQTEEVKACIVCGREGAPIYSGVSDQLFGAQGAWSYVRCHVDGQVWLTPRPTISDIGKAYERYYTHSVPGSKDRERSLLGKIRLWIEERAISEFFGYQRPGDSQYSFIIRALPMAKEFAGSAVMWLHSDGKGRLLDVGCGNGGLISQMQALGWIGAGIEPDHGSAAIARALPGSPVIWESLDSLNSLSDQFDAVTSHHTIEHMHDPRAFLRCTYRLLRPGGKIVIVTPNISSFGHRIFGQSWRGLEPPRHLQLFTPQALTHCLIDAGFHQVDSHTSARSAWEIWSLSRLIGKYPNGVPGRIPARIQVEGLVFQLFEHFISKIFSAAGEAVVVTGCKPLR